MNLKKRILAIANTIFFVGLVGLPFFWMVATSLKSGLESFDPRVIIPSSLNWKSYTTVLFELNFAKYFLNSTYVIIPAILLTIGLGILSGYAITRLRFRGKAHVSTLLVTTYAIPPILLVIPLYIVATWVGGINNLNFLIVIYVARLLPFAIYLFMSYFKTLPEEVEDAARIDGCSRIQTIWHVIIPLSLPAVISITIYTFMIGWNEFLFASIFLREQNFTLTVGLHHLFTSIHSSWNLAMAGAVIVMVPVLIVFLLLEKYLIRGLTAGALKG